MEMTDKEKKEFLEEWLEKHPGLDDFNKGYIAARIDSLTRRISRQERVKTNNI